MANLTSILGGIQTNLSQITNNDVDIYDLQITNEVQDTRLTTSEVAIS